MDIAFIEICIQGLYSQTFQPFLNSVIKSLSARHFEQFQLPLCPFRPNSIPVPFVLIINMFILLSETWVWHKKKKKSKHGSFGIIQKHQNYSALTLYLCRNTWNPVSLRWPPPLLDFHSQRCRSSGVESLCYRSHPQLSSTDGFLQCTSRQRLPGRNNAATLRSRSRKATKRQERRCHKQTFYFIFPIHI